MKSEEGKKGRGTEQNEGEQEINTATSLDSD